MTTQAYEQVFPGFGAYLLLIMVIVLSTTTILTYWYYGSKCMGFLFGVSKEKYLYVCLYGTDNSRCRCFSGHGD